MYKTTLNPAMPHGNLLVEQGIDSCQHMPNQRCNGLNLPRELNKLFNECSYKQLQALQAVTSSYKH
jgi:hypothetical protein